MSKSIRELAQEIVDRTIENAEVNLGHYVTSDEKTMHYLKLNMRNEIEKILIAVNNRNASNNELLNEIEQRTKALRGVIGF